MCQVWMWWAYSSDGREKTMYTVLGKTGWKAVIWSSCCCFYVLNIILLKGAHARFEVLMAVKIQVAVFCVVTQCGDVVGYHRFGGFSPCTGWIWKQHPEDGDNMVLRNRDILPHHYSVRTQKTSTWYVADFPTFITIENLWTIHCILVLLYIECTSVVPTAELRTAVMVCW
jgi:hypothetical protein